MTEPITYTMSFGLTKLNLALTDDRFVSRGSMQNVDVPLSSLRNFCIVPVKSDAGAYDSELVVSWDEAGKTKPRNSTSAAAMFRFNNSWRHCKRSARTRACCIWSQRRRKNRWVYSARKNSPGS